MQNFGRERHVTSRYARPEDRKDFRCWRLSAGPCIRPYWNFDELRGRLTIELHKGGKAQYYDLTTAQLEMARFGWRWLVAQAVRQVRSDLSVSAAFSKKLGGERP